MVFTYLPLSHPEHQSRILSLWNPSVRGSTVFKVTTNNPKRKNKRLPPCNLRAVDLGACSGDMTLSLSLLGTPSLCFRWGFCLPLLHRQAARFVTLAPCSVRLAYFWLLYHLPFSLQFTGIPLLPLRIPKSLLSLEYSPAFFYCSFPFNGPVEAVSCLSPHLGFEFSFFKVEEMSWPQSCGL